MMHPIPADLSEQRAQRNRLEILTAVTLIFFGAGATTGFLLAASHNPVDRPDRTLDQHIGIGLAAAGAVALALLQCFHNVLTAAQRARATASGVSGAAGIAFMAIGIAAASGRLTDNREIRIAATVLGVTASFGLIALAMCLHTSVVSSEARLGDNAQRLLAAPQSSAATRARDALYVVPLSG